MLCALKGAGRKLWGIKFTRQVPLVPAGESCKTDVFGKDQESWYQRYVDQSGRGVLPTLIIIYEPVEKGAEAAPPSEEETVSAGRLSLHYKNDIRVCIPPDVLL